MMKQADRSDGLRGYDDMVATFVDAGLAPPPVPDNLRSSVRQLRAWCWATQDINPMAMYLFREYPDEFLASGADQYFAVCHAGHGVNSYAISLHAVVGRLGVFTQTAWGGVYMDNEAQATLLERQFARVSELFDLIPPESRTHMEDGLLVLQSEFRGMAYCGPIHDSVSGRDTARWYETNRVEGTDPLLLAAKRLGRLAEELPPPAS